MSYIENIKSYSGQNLDTIFFRPMLTGESAEDLGIKVLYNVPMPTMLNFWRRPSNVLRKFTNDGWKSGDRPQKFQKMITMHKVKAECSYRASDYFSTVFELIAARPDVNFEDLSGTELEEAETTLFRAAIAESIRATMWYGDTSRSNGYNTFDGFVKQISKYHDSDMVSIGFGKGGNDGKWAENLLKQMWEQSNDELKQLRSEGNLAFFVTSDIYNAYENSLDNVAIEAAYLARQTGRDQLFYRGIPVVDLHLGAYEYNIGDLPKTFALLTDRRNLALAVNTSEFPGSEVRMWYNPDAMENRQRAVFAAGCDYLLPELITWAVEVPVVEASASCDGENLSVDVLWGNTSQIEDAYVSAYDTSGELVCDSEEVEVVLGGSASLQYEMSSLSRAIMTIKLTSGSYVQYNLPIV